MNIGSGPTLSNDSKSLDTQNSYDGPRTPELSEYPQIIEFLNTHLRPEKKWSIVNEYPIALDQKNLNNLKIIRNKDEILSHAAVVPVIVKTPYAIFKVATIGSVVTSTQHRNQGLSSQVIKACLQTASLMKCDLAVLWSNLFDFYRNLGFELAGSEVSFIIDRSIQNHLISHKELKFLETPKIDPECLLKLYQQHTVTSLRKPEQIKKFLLIPQSKIYTAWDTAGVMKAYAVEGKGLDLSGYIHEWGGSVNDLLPLFSYIQEKQNRDLTLITPSHSQNLHHSLSELGLRSHHGFLGMIHMVQPYQFFEKIKTIALRAGIQDLSIEEINQSYQLKINNMKIQISTLHEIVRLIFGPEKPSELYSIDKKTELTLERIFPMPFWIWGWDSI